ncbi:MAG: GspE/PulE family protein [Candidatus Omnitrophota bacterium]
MTEQEAKELAKQKGFDYIKLSEHELDPQIVHLLPENIARQHKAISVKLEENVLHVAFVSPQDLAARDEIELLTGNRIKPMIALEKEVQQAMNKYYKVDAKSKQDLIDMRIKKMRETQKEAQDSDIKEIGKVEDIPIVRLVNDFIYGAITAKASDIHLEPQDPEMMVRYRVDGILHDIMKIPKHIEAAVVSRIKVLSNMDITEKRRSQDGHLSIKKDKKDYDFRISTMKAINGEKVVIRILDRSSMLLSLEKLGLNEPDEKVFRSLITKPYGMILVTGPTGSGKTTTLYSALSQFDAKKLNIVTIEDPVEYQLDRITQIQVDPSSDMTFSNGLRTILRQDPDVIMVGEIRDKETAEIAIQAALTGHLVLSTLHTNDAPSAVTRLLDMDIEPFLISSTVIGAISQRLVRVICPECQGEYTASAEELKELQLNLQNQIKLAKGKGCDYCYQTGFRGRVAVFEVMRVTPAIQKLVLERKSSTEIKELAVQEGMKTLQANGVGKVVNKISTFEEVKRVIYVSAEDNNA